MIPRQRSHPFYRVVIALKGATQRTHGQEMKETMSLLPPQGMVLRSIQAAHPPHPERVEMRSNHAAHPPVAGGVVQHSNKAALPLHQVQVEQCSIQAAHLQHKGGMGLVYMTCSARGLENYSIVTSSPNPLTTQGTCESSRQTCLKQYCKQG